MTTEIFPWHAGYYAQLVQRAENLPHALLLRGPAGIGKLAFAQVLARRLLCENPGASTTGCGTCPACHWFNAGAHPDFRLLEPEPVDEDGEEDATGKKKTRLISVDQVRALSDFIQMTSHRGGVKVILIHPAETMNPNAANALLKNLEEPPPRTFFLLVSHRPNLLLATIKSRCQQIALTIPTAAEAEKWLRAQSGVKPDLALAQAGGMPLAAANLDNSEYWAQRAQFLDALTVHPFEPLAAAERAAALPVPQIVRWLQQWTLDLVYMKFLNKIRYNPDYHAALTPEAKRLDGLSALRYHRELVRLQRVVEHPLNARLLIEDLLLAYVQLLKPVTP